MNPAKVTIVGGYGGVGSALAYTLSSTDAPYELALIGLRSECVTSQLMDLGGITPFTRTAVRSGDIDDFTNSDVVVIAASVSFEPLRSRLDFLSGNVEVLRPYFRALAELPADWSGHVIVVTNPVDPLTTWLSHSARIDRHHILGYSWNDTLRLRIAVGRVLRAGPSEVVGWVIGEHGDGCVPLFDRISFSGVPVRLSPEQQRSVHAEISGWYARWAALGVSRTTAWTTATGVARMIHDLVSRTPAEWCAAVPLNGEYDIDGVAIGVPVTLGLNHVPSVHEWRLAQHDSHALHQAAEVIRRYAYQCDDMLAV
ncbi:malate dehydrogenase [Actinoallomurus sp. CA-142502]|uniref:malate dehydrogenase n=1 Tax=Actinoallomurus sp. CA-142502 TaxID=3239885 RepID=UPI003D8A189E